MKHPHLVLAGLALALCTVAAPASLAADPLWNLGDLYATPAAWEASFDRTRADLQNLGMLRGTLGTDSASMFKALDTISSLNKEVARLNVYSSLKGDEDLRVAEAQERNQRAQALNTQLSEQTAWVAPELLAVGADRIKQFEGEQPELARRFGFYLANTLRYAPHTLGEEGEGVLAAAGDVLQQPGTLHSQFANGELPYPTIVLEKGKRVRLDQSAYEKYRQSPDRAVRKEVFDAFWGAWKKYQNTVGNMLTTQVMGDVFSAKARRFDSALEAANFSSNMPPAVYRMLVEQAHAGLPVLHRYLRLRKARLGIKDDLQYYDGYAPLFPAPKGLNFSVEDSKRITLAALQPLGDEYLSLMKQGFASNWMNVYPSQGKNSGAYMNGAAYDVHPYLLLNHNGDYMSLSTFAHEWGHAVHTLLTTKAQPYENSNYSTFVAETASIGNQMLLDDYMVKNARTKAERLYYLGNSLETIRQIFFRQVMFAEFELALHQEVEQGHALSGARMSEMYCGLLRKYQGEAEGVMKINPTYCTEWAYIPHFYLDFYVWQYATSMAGAASMTDAILSEGQPAQQRFVNMLKEGGSDYPYEIYRRAGLDMASPAPYQALVSRMSRLLDQIEALDKQP
ncbi:MAG TPA: M3 family oligoendopeptidase [Steroidobacteraceae bacterium]|nr:M3 family oligoendopeptidase [Steroidobacteraceae bacterium]